MLPCVDRVWKEQCVRSLAIRLKSIFVQAVVDEPIDEGLSPAFTDFLVKASAVAFIGAVCVANDAQVDGGVGVEPSQQLLGDIEAFWVEVFSIALEVNAEDVCSETG